MFQLHRNDDVPRLQAGRQENYRKRERAGEIGAERGPPLTENRLFKCADTLTSQITKLSFKKGTA